MASTPAPELPPEVLDEIFAYSVLELPLQKANSLLSTFSLVARAWTGVAQRLMLNKIVVKGAEQTKALIRSTRRLDRGGAARSLAVYFQPQEQVEHVPNAKEIEQKNMVSMDDFVTLLKQTTRVQRLLLELPTFIRFRRRDAQDLATIFAGLTDLAMRTKMFDKNQEVLRSILEAAPALKFLALSCDAAGPTSYQIPSIVVRAQSIKSLTLDGRIHTLAVLAQQPPLLPSAALQSVEEFTFQSVHLDDPTKLDNAVNVFANLHGIKKIVDQSSNWEVSGDMWQRIIPLLPNLEEIHGDVLFSDSAILDKLATKVRALECYALPSFYNWFKANASNAQSTFAVDHLTLNFVLDIDQDDYLAPLPSTIKYLRLGGSYKDLFDCAGQLTWQRFRQLDFLELRNNVLLVDEDELADIVYVCQLNGIRHTITEMGDGE